MPQSILHNVAKPIRNLDFCENCNLARVRGMKYLCNSYNMADDKECGIESVMWVTKAVKMLFQYLG